MELTPTQIEIIARVVRQHAARFHTRPLDRADVEAIVRECLVPQVDEIDRLTRELREARAAVRALDLLTPWSEEDKDGVFERHADAIRAAERDGE